MGAKTSGRNNYTNINLFSFVSLQHIAFLFKKPEKYERGGLQSANKENQCSILGLIRKKRLMGDDFQRIYGFEGKREEVKAD